MYYVGIYSEVYKRDHWNLTSLNYKTLLLYYVGIYFEVYKGDNWNLTSLNYKTLLMYYVGIYSEVYKGDHWNLTVKMYAHRSFTRLLATEMILYTDGKDKIKLDFHQNQGPPSTDLLLVTGTSKIPNSRLDIHLSVCVVFNSLSHNPDPE